MSTFLELCQAVALESGTVPGSGNPSAVTSQTGRLLNVVNWTKAAWENVQRHHPHWRWMRAGFSGSTLTTVQAYDAAAMGISSRFSNWLTEDEGGKPFMTVYKTADGYGDEGFLTFVPYDEFRRKYMIGSAQDETGKPVVVTVNDNNELVFFPTPDGVYTVRGLYQKSIQVLAVNAEEPEMPSQFHDLIKWNALILLGIYDEAVVQSPAWQYQAEKLMDQLESNQLPKTRLPGAWA